MKAEHRGAVFLDRDGVVNRRLVGTYVTKPAEFEALPGSLEAIARLIRAGRVVTVITNQAGIGRGLMNDQQLRSVHGALGEQLRGLGVELAGIYHCPHHPDDGCACRKPGIEMIERASREHGIRLDGSYLVGDSPTDIEAGRAAGLYTILATGDRHEPYPPEAAAPDRVVRDLSDAVDWILSR